MIVDNFVALDKYFPNVSSGPVENILLNLYIYTVLAYSLVLHVSVAVQKIGGICLQLQIWEESAKKWYFS